MPGLNDKDPVECFDKKYNLALFLKIELTTDNFLSHLLGYRKGIWLFLYFVPLLKTVAIPVAFLPALLTEKNLKNFFKEKNFNEKITFLNLSVLVKGLNFFIKI